MSIKLQEAVTKHSASRGAARYVLSQLAARANKEGICWPHIRRICEDTGLSRRSVFYALKRLQDLGELSVLSGKMEGRGNCYRLEIGREGECKSCTPGVQILHTRSANFAHPVPYYVSEPSGELKGEPESLEDSDTMFHSQPANVPTVGTHYPRAQARERTHTPAHTHKHTSTHKAEQGDSEEGERGEGEGRESARALSAENPEEEGKENAGKGKAPASCSSDSTKTDTASPGKSAELGLCTRESEKDKKNPPCSARPPCHRAFASGRTMSTWRAQLLGKDASSSTPSPDRNHP